MKSSLRVAGAVAFCSALLIAGCSKSTDTSSTSSSTATTAPADAATAAAEATSAPDSTATASSTSAGGTTVTSSTGSGKAGYIELPVYPGSTEDKSQGLAMSANGGSVAMKVYTSKDDAKAIAEWYKAHLPAAWKNGILTTDGKTIGTFSNELSDGDQSIIVSSDDSKTTRIQLATKHGK